MAPTSTTRRTSTMSDSDADRRRNRLGYRRITIACTHCRRRKIRCVIIDGDTSQRCDTCSRLGKDCVFTPVENENGQTGSTSRDRTAGATRHSSTVSSSSPRTASDDDGDDGHRHQSAHGHGSYQGIPVQPMQTIPGQDDSVRSIEDGYHPRDEAQPTWQQSGPYGIPIYPAVNGHDGRLGWPYSSPSAAHDPNLFHHDAHHFAHHPYPDRRHTQQYSHPTSSGSPWLPPVRSTSLGPAGLTPPQTLYPTPFPSDSIDPYPGYHSHSLAVPGSSLAPSAPGAEPVTSGAPHFDYPPHSRPDRSYAYAPNTTGAQDGWYPHASYPDGNSARTLGGQRGRPPYELQSLS